MLDYTRIEPLTPEQSRYAAEHYSLVHKFLKRKRLSEDTFFDVVIFGYLYAVKRYLEEEELQNWAFSTIAWKAMRRTVGHYWASQARPSRKAVVCSLDNTDPERPDLTLYELYPDLSEDVELELEDKMLEAAMLSRLTKEQRKLVFLREAGWSEREIPGKLHWPREKLKEQSEQLRELFEDYLQAS